MLELNLVTERTKKKFSIRPKNLASFSNIFLKKIPFSSYFFFLIYHFIFFEGKTNLRNVMEMNSEDW